MMKFLPNKGSGWTLTSGVSYLILFIIWPFLALVLALANYKDRDARKVVYFYLVYFGLTFVAVHRYMDAGRYIQTFQMYSTLPFKEFFKILGGFYSDDASLDIIEPFIAFVVSRFTQSYHILFAAFAALFAFFYLKSFNLLYERYREKPDLNAWVFMVFFIIVIPVTTINAPRMWIAAWIFFYGAYHAIVYRKPGYLLMALAACLMHWSFITVNVLLIAYFFAGNRNLIYTPLAIASFFVPQVVYPLFESASMFIGGPVETRYSNYTSESYSEVVQDLAAQSSWFLVLNRNLIFYYFIFAVVMIRVFRRDLMRGKMEENWYSFLLLLFSMVNFGRALPAFGYRMQTIFILFAAVYVFFYFSNLAAERLKFITLVGLFPMLLYTFVEFRIGSETIKYPFSAIINNTNQTFNFETSAIPELNQIVTNPNRNDLLYNAYHFIPGQTLQFEMMNKKIDWVVESDIYKNTYILCNTSGAKAFYKHVGDVFYFTSYDGRRDALLYYFFLSSFKVVTAYYNGMKITDSFPLSLYPGKFIKLVQDFCAPFFKFLSTRFELAYTSNTEKGDQTEIILESKAYFGYQQLRMPNFEFKILIDSKGISKILTTTGDNEMKAVRIF